ncbi:unnamed protein product [Symbiodinium sp. CCMP2456]|nr:unnamed protein product [Symbiodinium sp. CCMP2456]
MFLFGGSGSSGQSEAGVAEDLQQEILDRDEEIAELKAKIEAYRDALEKEPHFEHFEMAMEEKNKVLEEQFIKVQELTKENQSLLERLQTAGPAGAHEGPESGSPEMEEQRQDQETNGNSPLEDELSRVKAELESVKAELQSRPLPSSQPAGDMQEDRSLGENQERLRSLEEQLQAAELAKRESDEARAACMAQLAALESEVPELRGKLAELEAMRNSALEATEEVEQLQLEMEMLREESAEVPALKAQIAGVEAEHAALQDAAAASAELHQKLERLQEEAAQVHEMRSRLAELEAERESAHKAQAAAEQLQQEVQRLQAEAAEAQAKLADSEAQCATAAQDAAGSAELQEEVNRLKSEIAQVPELQAAAEKLQLEVERLTAEAVEAQRAAALQDAAGMAELQQQLDRLRSEASEADGCPICGPGWRSSRPLQPGRLSQRPPLSAEAVQPASSVSICGHTAI